jgi:ATP-dependent helicase/nuclease subunit B
MPRRLGKNPEIYNISAHHSFVDVLVSGMMARYGSDPLILSEILILLPNRRAVRSLRDAFLRFHDGKSVILPRIQPIGDVDEDMLVMAAGIDDLSLKPAIPTYVRQILLMDIINKWYKQRNETPPDCSQGLILAQALGQFLDHVQTEALTFKDLEKIVPDEFSIHWQETLNFLKILTEHWPTVLNSTGYMDAAERRNQLLFNLREKWLIDPPQHPVIAAGSTGSIKATSSLLEVVARLPNGMVLLPGLDIHIDDESWNALEDTHPQSTMKNLLQTLQADRSEVKDWLTNDFSDEKSPIKTELFREIMRPAETTNRWRDISFDIDDALKNIQQIITPGQREEAGIIALMMREMLNKPGKTAALITPDRQLARRVSGELSRWGIQIDDSAGTPLFNTTMGIYLRLVAAMVGEQMAPITLLSALKHPFMAGGMEVGEFRSLVRRLEKGFLRGPRPSPNLKGISDLIKNKKESHDEELIKWWENIVEIIKPFETAIRKNKCSFEELLYHHVHVAEQLAGNDRDTGANLLWKGDAGEAAANLIEELMLAAPYLSNMKADQYPALFDQFMAGVTVRLKYGQHPRLNIWGPLEARLQHADLMILSGLNEGSWPPDPAVDPWLSRPMRKEFGLPSLEQKIGLSAHDFVQTASAGNVVITRSEKPDGTPTIKSRWLSRLHAITGHYTNDVDAQKWINWFKLLDQPNEFHEIDPPSPKPPLASRPRKLSVTRIQAWMQDPYSLYARDILKLNPLNELDEDPGASDKGIIIHRALDEFLSLYKDELPLDAENQLIEIGRQAFGKVLDRPTVWSFWWPRFKQISHWFIENEENQRKTQKTMATEVKGQLVICQTSGGEFTLSAVADRIDQFLDGSYSIIDYKTGQPPTSRQVKAGFAPQLPLEAVIAAAGGFGGVDAGRVSELAYWKLTGGENVAERKIFNETMRPPSNMNITAVAEQAEEGLINLITTFDLVSTPYLSNPRPDQLGYGEYDHLARVKEWSVREDTE